ncbi:MAG: RNA-binding protein [Candidatus Aureabacteria bacterium]|nr:RNA-binding protein [Candidatus Auribacterota bacterium]
MNIYTGNLSYEVTEEDLKQAFEAFGDVESVKIIKDKYTDRSKGFGFVEMPNDENAQSAIDGLNDTEIKGRKLLVNKARPRTEGRDNRGGYGGGGRGGRQGGGRRF